MNYGINLAATIGFLKFKLVLIVTRISPKVK